MIIWTSNNFLRDICQPCLHESGQKWWTQVSPTKTCLIDKYQVLEYFFVLSVVPSCLIRNAIQGIRRFTFWQMVCQKFGPSLVRATFCGLFRGPNPTQNAREVNQNWSEKCILMSAADSACWSFGFLSGESLSPHMHSNHASQTHNCPSDHWSSSGWGYSGTFWDMFCFAVSCTSFAPSPCAPCLHSPFATVSFRPQNGEAKAFNEFLLEITHASRCLHSYINWMWHFYFWHFFWKWYKFIFSCLGMLPIQVVHDILALMSA